MKGSLNWLDVGEKVIVFPAGLQAEAVIFDFDGVIVDTEPLHYKAFQRILEPMGLGFSWEQYIDTYMGFDDRDAFIEAFTSKGEKLDHNELTNLVLSKATIFQEVIRDGVNPYPGAVELIINLHRANIPLAICSGALHSDIVPILSMLGVSGCFNIIVAADDVSKSKPHPESYRLAFERLNKYWPQLELSTLSTLAIEDTPAGITSALESGLRVIAVTNSYSRELISKATHVVDSLEELVKFRSP